MNPATDGNMDNHTGTGILKADRLGILVFYMGCPFLYHIMKGMTNMDFWRNFVDGNWKNTIDVSDFIKKNYTPYDGDASFLEGPTDRTAYLKNKVDELLIEENKKGGVLDIDTDKVSSILTYEPGYIEKGKDIILGLQTDKPLKRAVNPFAGYRNAAQACQAYGYEIGENVKDEMTASGGRLYMSYTIDVNYGMLSRNSVEIKVKEV